VVLVFEHGGKKMRTENRIISMDVVCCNCHYSGIAIVKQTQMTGVTTGRYRATKTPDVWICTKCMEAILSQ